MKQPFCFLQLINLFLCEVTYLLDCLGPVIRRLGSSNLLNYNYFLDLSLQIKQEQLYLMKKLLLLHARSKIWFFQMIYFNTNLFVHVMSKSWNMALLMYRTCGTIIDLHFSSRIIIMWSASMFNNDDMKVLKWMSITSMSNNKPFIFMNGIASFVCFQ